jgi:hypothetical protein
MVASVRSGVSPCSGSTGAGFSQDAKEKRAAAKKQMPRNLGICDLMLLNIYNSKIRM